MGGGVNMSTGGGLREEKNHRSSSSDRVKKMDSEQRQEAGVSHIVSDLIRVTKGARANTDIKLIKKIHTLHISD